jgi:hypothetical protein
MMGEKYILTACQPWGHWWSEMIEVSMLLLTAAEEVVNDENTKTYKVPSLFVDATAG